MYPTNYLWNSSKSTRLLGRLCILRSRCELRVHSGTDQPTPLSPVLGASFHPVKRRLTSLRSAKSQLEKQRSVSAEPAVCENTHVQSQLIHFILLVPFLNPTQVTGCDSQKDKDTIRKTWVTLIVYLDTSVDEIPAAIHIRYSFSCKGEHIDAHSLTDARSECRYSRTRCLICG